MLMAGREQLWSSEPHPGLVPSGRSRVPCQLWVTWAGLKELGGREDRAGRLEPWARVTWGSAAGPEGTTGPFSKEPVGRRLCLCFAWTWASEELRCSPVSHTHWVGGGCQPGPLWGDQASRT